MFTGLFPILTTSDLARLREFYLEGLGATETYRFPEVRPVFVTLEVDGDQLGIAYDPACEPAVTSYALCLETRHCDAAVEQLTRHGATILEAPTDQPWGERVARMADPDGNQLVISAPIEPYDPGA